MREQVGHRLLLVRLNSSNEDSAEIGGRCGRGRTVGHDDSQADVSASMLYSDNESCVLPARETLCQNSFIPRDSDL